MRTIKLRLPQQIARNLRHTFVYSVRARSLQSKDGTLGSVQNFTSFATAVLVLELCFQIADALGQRGKQVRDTRLLLTIKAYCNSLKHCARARRRKHVRKTHYS